MLPLTGRDVLNQQFGKPVRKGYDPAAVDNFLKLVAQRIDYLTAALAQSAQPEATARVLVTEARSRAEAIMQRANAEAERVAREAATAAGSLLVTTQREAEQTMARARANAAQVSAATAAEVEQMQRTHDSRVAAARASLERAEHLGAIANEVLRLVRELADEPVRAGTPESIDLRLA